MRSRTRGSDPPTPLSLLPFFALETQQTIYLKRLFGKEELTAFWILECPDVFVHLAGLVCEPRSGMKKAGLSSPLKILTKLTYCINI
jgi:hypothetical protein